MIFGREMKNAEQYEATFIAFFVTMKRREIVREMKEAIDG